MPQSRGRSKSPARKAKSPKVTTPKHLVTHNKIAPASAPPPQSEITFSPVALRRRASLGENQQQGLLNQQAPENNASRYLWASPITSPIKIATAATAEVTIAGKRLLDTATQMTTGRHYYNNLEEDVAQTRSNIDYPRKFDFIVATITFISLYGCIHTYFEANQDQIPDSVKPLADFLFKCSAMLELTSGPSITEQSKPSYFSW